MARIAFLLNGSPVEIDEASPTRTLLDWLRESRGLKGTKEGCNEGDCGACTVMLTDAQGARAVNACILLLPQIHGRAIRTIEGIKGPGGQAHPVQDAMVSHHASQCGFCTPGFVVSLAVAHLNGQRRHDDVLAGNLCRCTGYAPIIRAAEAAADAPVPDWMRTDASALTQLQAEAQHSARILIPEGLDDFASWYLDHPEAVLVAGATDVGLWITKQLREPDCMAFLGNLTELQGIEIRDGWLHVGAGVTLARLHGALADHLPALRELLRRHGSPLVRASATLGGNIANGSPIGDTPPALIALGARLHLRRGAQRRDIALEDFFIEYRRQDRQSGEFVEAVSFPLAAPAFRTWKISKRFDQDISAVCGAFNARIENGVIHGPRLAFGGMAGIPARARHAEAALEGQPFTEASIRAAMAAMAQDFQPLSDMRASAAYRLQVAQNLCLRWFHDLSGAPVSVLEVQP